MRAPYLLPRTSPEPSSFPLLLPPLRRPKRRFQSTGSCAKWSSPSRPERSPNLTPPVWDWCSCTTRMRRGPGARGWPSTGAPLAGSQWRRAASLRSGSWRGTSAEGAGQMHGALVKRLDGLTLVRGGGLKLSDPPSKGGHVRLGTRPGQRREGGPVWLLIDPSRPRHEAVILKLFHRLLKYCDILILAVADTHLPAAQNLCTTRCAVQCCPPCPPPSSASAPVLPASSSPPPRPLSDPPLRSWFQAGFTPAGVSLLLLSACC